MALALLGSSCTTEAPPPPPPTPVSNVKVSPDGGLKVGVRKAVVEGSVLRVSGTVVNHYDRRVEGIRYTVVMAIPGSPPRIIDTARQETDTALDPGEAKAMSLEIANPIYASATGMFGVDAVPVKLGGAAVPPPAGWK
ncbi:MAG TPA: hypothetical protein VL049_18625 [Candidatus Dormibacteraeota bacterium]|nr:hypothetical protein [Candidatus Dormibacteraeota bacterium]